MGIDELTVCSEIASVEIAQRQTLEVLRRIEASLAQIARIQAEILNRTAGGTADPHCRSTRPS